MSTNLVLGIVSSLLASALITVLVTMRRRWGPIFSGLSTTLHLARRFRTLGVSQVFGSRSDYQTYRGTATLIDYFRLANLSVEMAAYWISYGVEAQGLAEEVCDLLVQKPSLSVTLAIVDPCSTHLDALAKHLNRPSEEIRDRIVNSLVKLTTARGQLPEAIRYRYQIKTYDSLPVASVIMLDRAAKDGRIQIDIKPYHAAQHNSFAIEVTGSQSLLYQHLSEAWGQLILDANEVDDVFASATESVSQLDAGG